MKNYGDLGGCYPPRPTASTDNTLLDPHNSSVRYSASFSKCLQISRLISIIQSKELNNTLRNGFFGATLTNGSLVCSSTYHVFFYRNDYYGVGCKPNLVFR